MSEIPERAFVVAERLKARQSSETEIRTALAEFELSEKQIKEVLKKAEEENPYVEMSDSQRDYFAGKKSSPFMTRFSRPSAKPLAGKTSLLDDIKEIFASSLLRVIVFFVLLALAIGCRFLMDSIFQ